MGGPITLSGFSSGIPTNEIISKLMAIERRPIDLLEFRKDTINQQQSVYTQIQGLVSKFQTTLNTMKANTSTSPDLFNRRKVESSNESIVSGTATSAAAAPQTITVEVTQRATATTAKSSGVGFENGLGALVEDTLPAGTQGTLVRSIHPGTATNGTVTIYVNGVATTVTIDKDDKIINNLANINSATGGVVNFTLGTDGKIIATSSGGELISFGASADTSNFFDVIAIKNQTPATTVSSRSLTKIDLGAQVTSASSNFRLGPVAGGSTFTIGSASFSVGTKSLSALITEINNSTDAAVTATYNSSTNKLELLSKVTGSQYITMADTSGDFLQKMGLINGSDTTASQTPGQNATAIINGSTVTSSSNVLGPDISGIGGVTLNLNAQAPGSPVSVYVKQDYDPLKTQINDFITNYNNLITSIDNNTNSQKGGTLTGEQGLVFFRNKLRTQVSNRNTDSNPYETLSTIGISTGAVTGANAGVTALLQLDNTKLEAALAGDPTRVKDLLVGLNGIITKAGSGLSDILSDALKDESDPGGDGLFAAHASAVTSRIQQINRAIDRGNDRLVQKEALLRRQYTAMETSITRLQSQGTAISSLSSQLAANR